MFYKSIQEIILLDFFLFVIFVVLVSQYKVFFFLITFVNLTYLTKSLFIKLMSLDEKSRERFYKSELIYIIIKWLIRKIDLEEESRKMAFSSSLVSDTASTKSELNVVLEMHLFMKKFSANLIEKWYLPNVSKNERFPRETQMQLEILLTDLFYMFTKIDKLEFFSQIIQLFNKNCLNIAIEFSETNVLPIERLHPALRNGHTSEIIYMRQFVQIVLRKSASNLNIESPFAQEFISELIGKNCIEKLVNLLSKPSFIYYSICLVCSREKTKAYFKSESSSSSKSTNNLVEHVISETTDTQPRNAEENIDIILSDALTEMNQMKEPEVNFDLSNANSFQNQFITQENNLYEEFNEKNLLSFKASTSSDSNPDFDIVIAKLEVISTETSYELKTRKQYTSYNIRIEYKPKILNYSSVLDTPVVVKNFKRRFKEFVLLQKKLEENPSYKSLLRNIKGPSKIINMPIGNMDEDVIEKRKKRLNDYLNKLIIIPQIFQSKELCLFLGNCSSKLFPRLVGERPRNSEKAIMRKLGGVIERLSSATFSRSFDDSNAESTNEYMSFSYEYSKQDSYEKFNLMLIDTTNRIMNSNKVNHEIFHEDLKSIKLDKREIHFSKNLLEIINKAIVTSSKQNHHSADCWINNQKFYSFAQSVLFDYYLERFFEEFFNEMLSENKLIEYLHDIEQILFDSNDDDEKSIFDKDEIKFFEFAQNLLNNLLPGLALQCIGEERFKGSIEILLNSLKIPMLNKHFVYCFFDLLLFFVYKGDFIDIF